MISKTSRIAVLMGAVFFFSACAAGAETFEIGPRNSTVIFKVTHPGGYTIGSFEDFSGSFSLNDDATRVTSLSGRLQVHSINTYNASRDASLRSELFLDVDKFPEASFAGTEAENNTLAGNMTIKGRTKPVAFTIRVRAVNKDPQGQTKASILAEAVINRSDFGVAFNKKLDTGQALIGNEVALILELEGSLKE